MAVRRGGHPRSTPAPPPWGQLSPRLPPGARGLQPCPELRESWALPFRPAQVFRPAGGRWRQDVMVLLDENLGGSILVSRERQGLGLMLLGLGSWKASLSFPFLK